MRVRITLNDVAFFDETFTVYGHGEIIKALTNYIGLMRDSPSGFCSAIHERVFPGQN